MKILIVGHNIRQIACSASRAGHQVLAADCYSDLDLIKSVQKAVRLNCDPAVPGDLVLASRKLIESAQENFSPDAVVLGPGLEYMKIKRIRVLNNRLQKITQVSDKLWLARWLEREGYPTIRTSHPKDLDKLNDLLLMVKPRRGAGGWGNRLVWSKEYLERLGNDFIIQEWVEGKPASASVIGNGEDAMTIAVNEQMIGIRWLGTKGFRYCGNITPLEASNDDSAKMAEMAEKIITDLKLVGSNGVDFLLTKNGPVVVEVNPRFQGSLDAVELSTKTNLFQDHLRSFEGILPQSPKPLRYAGRAILFANRDVKIAYDLQKVTECIADVPRRGSIIKRYEPIVSILALGENRKKIMDLLQNRSSAIQQRFRHV
ncbi:MAG: ATP-grasp domain-containing protein [Methanotrichaceae archaeon]